MRTRSFRGVTLQPAGDSLIEETLLSPLVESQQIGPDRAANHATAGVADSAEERTRLRPALAASLESEMGLRLVLDAADMGTFAWHIQEDRCEPDQRMLALLGVPPGRTFSLGDAIISFIHPEDQRRCADSFAHAIDSVGTGALREEIRGLHSDGSVRWLSIIGQTVFDHVTAATSDGVTARRPVRMSGLVSDITHRKHHEASLALLDQIADDCARLSTAGDIMQVVGARLGAYLHVPSVCLVNIDETRDELRIVHMWNEAGTASRPDVVRLSDCVTAAFREAARAGHTLVVQDTETDLRTDAVMHAALGVRSFISVPFIRDGAWRFMLTVCDTRPHHWPDDEVGFFRKLADRLFARMEHALAEQAVATDLRDTQLLRDLSVRLVSESDAQAFFDAIVAAAIPMTGAKAGCLRLLDSKTNELVMLAESGFDPPLADFGTVDATSPTCCCRALATGERAFIDYDDPGVPDPKGCFRPSVGIRTAQSTPLVTRAGRTLGMLSTYWEERHHRLSERELHFLDLLARQAAEMIERRRNESALRESEQRLSAELADTQLLQRLSAQLIEERGSASLYETLVDVARSIMRSEYATMQTLHPERGAGGELLLIASRGLTEEARQLWKWVRAEQSTTCALALRTSARFVVSDIASCGAMAGTVDQALLLEGGIRAAQTTPLVSRGGKLLGMITTHWSKPHQPSERDFRLLDILARQAADLMERTQAEEALRRSERQLKEADRRKDEFLATLAHELRNPLAPLRTSLEVIRLAGDTPESVEEVRTTMEEQVDLLVRLVDDLLDVSRITSGKIRLYRRTTQLAPLVATAVQANRAAVDAGHVTLRVDLPESPLLIDADPTRFVQIVSNVLINAVKFTDPGGRITISAELQDSANGDARWVALTVADSGIGISQDMLPRVFDLFTQDDVTAHRSHTGLGIGLALARRLIEMHGGSIEAQSDGPGLGSTFRLRMPLSKGVADTRQAAPRPVAPRISRRVVVIDDNPAAARAIQRLVHALGGECRMAHDGETGLAQIREFRPDIVILDVGMPRLDGYETCRRLRAEFGSNMIVVALTGWGQDRDKRKAMRAGFDVHLTKPAEPVMLEALLAGVPASSLTSDEDPNTV